MASSPRRPPSEPTSDRLLDKFVPNDRSMRYGSLGNGGRLAAMKVGDLYRLGHVRAVGTVLPVSWTESCFR